MTTNIKQEIPTSTLDHILSAQLIVAWSGEGGEEPRLGWWRTDFCSEFGGEDFFKRLLPKTWEWATYQSVLEAARRMEASRSSEIHDADTLFSLFDLGFSVNERLEERFQSLKQSDRPPQDALPKLNAVVSQEWNEANFKDWVSGHGEVTFEKLPVGRRVRGDVPDSLELIVDKLVAGLAPVTEEYPMPYFRSKK